MEQAKKPRKGIRMLKRRLILIVVVLCILLACFAGGALWSQRRTRTEITSDLISQRLNAISELATVEYYYTNMGKFENQVDFYGWKVPLTKKSFIVSYDGVIKAGINAANLKTEINGNTITVTLPPSEILSHQIDDDSLEIFDESKNIFNPLRIEDYTSFSADQKAGIEQRAIDNGLLVEASEKAKSAVRELLTLAVAEPEKYTFVVK